MGLFSRKSKGTKPPVDDKARYLERRIAEATPDDASELAQAAAVLAGHGSIAYGMVVQPIDEPLRQMLVAKATAALARLLPDIPDEQCASVFRNVETAKLGVDIAPRRTAYETKQRDRARDFLFRSIAASRNAGDALALAEAWAGLGPTRMAFGMVVPESIDREAMRAKIVDAIRPMIAELSPRDIEALHRVVERVGLPIDLSDRLATIAAERDAERAQARALAGRDEPQDPALEREIAARFDAECDAGERSPLAEIVQPRDDAAPTDDDHGRAGRDDDRDAPFLVYADWLQSQGHPRGELIALQLRERADRKATALPPPSTRVIDAHASALLGPLAPYRHVQDGSERNAFTWSRGFIRRAFLSNHDSATDDPELGVAEILELLLLHPSARYLRELAIGIDGEGTEEPLDDVIALLAREAPSSLRALYLGAFDYPDQTEMSWYEVGDLAPLWPRLRGQLRELIVQGGSFELGTLDLPVLERATFRTGGLSSANVEAIHAAKWPNLRSLEIWYGDPNYGGDASIDDVRSLLARTDLPHLEHLGLMNCAFSDECVTALLASPIATQLTSLDLSLGTLSEDGARELLASRAQLPKLHRLNVNRAYITEATANALSEAFGEVFADDLEDPETDPEDRFPSVGE